MNTKSMVTLAYADDSITASDEPVKMTGVHPPVGTGIVIHTEKSGVIKRNGHWKGALKFLGLKFDGKVLQAATRKGSKLIFSKRIGQLIKLDTVRLEQGLKLESTKDILEFLESNQYVSKEFVKGK